MKKQPKFRSTKFKGVYARGGKFSYRLTGVRRSDDTIGDLWVGGFETATEAYRERMAASTAVKTNSFVAPTKLTVESFLQDKWLPSIEQRLRASTFAGYRSILTTHVIPRIGHKRLGDLDPSDLNALYADLLKDGRRNGRGGLSSKSTRNVAVVCGKFLADAERWRLIARNPAPLADPPKQAAPGSVEMATWSAVELKTFLEHDGVIANRLFAAWRLVAMTGCRRGEALGLRWSDVDFANGRIAVRQTLVLVDNRPQLSQPKTKRSRRTVPLDATTLATLKAHKARQAQERLLYGPGYVAGDLVFTKEDGTPVHPDSFSGYFERLVKAAELPRIRLHDLRHTFATLALQSGAHPKVVSDRLGHSTISFTLDVYSHAIPAMEEEAAESFARLVMG